MRRRDPPERPITRRRALQLLTSGAATLVLAALGASGVRQADELVIERIGARLSGLTEPLRVAFVSDLHYGPYTRAPRVARWVDAVLSTAPDLVLLGGDLVDRYAPRDLMPLLDELARLAERSAPLGTFAVLGNHEYGRFLDPRPFLRDLDAVGVTPLVNAGVTLAGGLYLAGVDDHRRGTPDLRAALAGRAEAAPTVLVSHNPDLLPLVPLDVQLTLCGHTHGGQVRPPFVGPLVTSSEYGRRFVAGWVDGPARGYVSRGLGVGFLPVRWDCPPELTLLELTPTAIGSDTPAVTAQRERVC